MPRAGALRSADQGRPARRELQLLDLGPGFRLPASVPAPPPPEVTVFDDPGTPLEGLVGVLQDVSPAPGNLGGPLVAALEALPPERAALGLNGLGAASFSQLCEEPELVAHGTGPDGDWSLEFRASAHSMTGTPRRRMIPLTQSCKDAMLVAGGIVAVPECSVVDQESFFPSGSECRSCLIVDGDFDRCVTEDLCPQTSTMVALLPNAGAGLALPHGVLEVDVLACAPDISATALLFVRDLEQGDPLPSLYEPGRLDYLCIPLWTADPYYPDLACVTAHTDYGHALIEVVPFVVQGLQVPSGERYQDRAAAASRVELTDGRVYDYYVAVDFDLGPLPVPYDQGGWGLNPRELKPGGTDPSDPEQTWGRELLGAMAVKASTTVDGVYVQPFVENRCVSWSEPDSRGTSTCTEVGPPTASLLSDGMVFGFPETGEHYQAPYTTLISTGLPEADDPSRTVLHVRGSETLNQLEGDCWEDPFVPDRMRFWGPPEGLDRPARAAFDGETYRFDRDPEIRVGLNTAQFRAFCPGQ